MRDYLIGTIQKTFEVGFDQAEKLYQELLECTRNKNLVSNILFFVNAFNYLYINLKSTKDS